MTRYLLAADPLSTFLPATDTSILMAFELLRCKIPTDYLDLSQMDWKHPDYLQRLRVAEIIEVFRHDSPPFRLGPWRTASVEEYGVILHRQDPPVDEEFVGHCRAFMSSPSSVLQINDPAVIWRISEHEIPMEFAQYSIPTRIVHSLDELIDGVKRSQCDLVAKPKNTYCAQGIEFFSQQSDRSLLERYWAQWGGAGSIVLQDYAREMETIGDLRVLSFDGNILGHVLRKPGKGSRVGSLHQGATAHPWNLTENQRRAALEISKNLSERGLYFLGLDFIGERISEINFTCPSALIQVNAVMKIEGQIELMRQIEALRVRRQGQT